MKDAALQFSADQAITASAKSTNSINLRAPERRIGSGRKVSVKMRVTEAFTDAGSDSTVTVVLESSPDVPVASPLTNPVARQTLHVFPALSAVGAEKEVVINPGDLNQRGVQLAYNVTGGNLTTGKISAWLVENEEQRAFYPDATEIT